MKNLLKIIIAAILIIGCNGTKTTTTTDNYEYSIEKPIEGQIYTVQSLKKYMDDKQYDKAISLFSKSERLNIKTFRENRDIFNSWCTAWTLDPEKFERYISKIKNKNAFFVFEEGQWKINEK